MRGAARTGSTTVFDHLRGELGHAFVRLGEQRLKNIERPVRAYRMALTHGSGSGPPERPALPLPDKPSLAVLPFENLSGDPEQGYFADGIAEEVITALSRAKWLFVITRNSSFAYRGKAVDVRQVGRELKAASPLDGPRRRRKRRAISGPKRATQTRTVS
jgi:adenylate cyclase